MRVKHKLFYISLLCGFFWIQNASVFAGYSKYIDCIDLLLSGVSMSLEEINSKLCGSMKIENSEIENIEKKK